MHFLHVAEESTSFGMSSIPDSIDPEILDSGGLLLHFMLYVWCVSDNRIM